MEEEEEEEAGAHSSLGKGLQSPTPRSPVASEYLHTLPEIWPVQNAGWQPQTVPRGTGSLTPSPSESQVTQPARPCGFSPVALHLSPGRRGA